MFENVGEKIKKLAKYECWAGIVLSIILAIIMFVTADEVSWKEEDVYLIYGWVFLVIGPAISICNSYFIYGFGELIQKVSNIERNTRVDQQKSKTQTAVDYERIEILEKLRAQGLITEEEYQEAIVKESK